MSKGVFDVFKHPDVRQALELRKQGKYKEAIVYLDKACNEEDGQAWYLKGHFYEYGGCGLYQNYVKMDQCYNNARNAGCVWVRHEITAEEAMSDLYANACKRRDDESLFTVAFTQGYFFVAVKVTAENIHIHELYAEQNDGCACCRLAEYWFYSSSNRNLQKAFYYDKKGAKQKVRNCISRLGDEHLKCYFDFFESTNWAIKSAINSVRLSAVLRNLCVSNTACDNNRRIWAFCKAGRKFVKGLSGIDHSPHKVEAISVYRTTWIAAQNNVITFLLCCKKSGIYKDIAQIVGKLIWASRKNAIPWIYPNNKKLKK